MSWLRRWWRRHRAYESHATVTTGNVAGCTVCDWLVAAPDEWTALGAAINHMAENSPRLAPLVASREEPQ